MSGEKQQTKIFTSALPEAPKLAAVRIKRGKKLSFSERLLRNTAIACALLLAILAVRNIGQPWSDTALRGIESALTMRVDLDGSLGKLSFVRSIMPESSLVFFNMSSEEPSVPVNGSVRHACLSGQMWTVYACEPGAEITAAMSGTVSAVNQLSAGDWCVLIDHSGGVETLYAYLEKPELESGAAVARGEIIGKSLDGSVYFEMRKNGEPVDPWGES